jgi:hypothetical protein
MMARKSLLARLAASALDEVSFKASSQGLATIKTRFGVARSGWSMGFNRKNHK